MTIELIAVGKTDSAEIAAIVEDYARRVNRYTKFTQIYLPDQRKGKYASAMVLKKLEGEMIMRQITDADHVVLLDDKGAQPRSMELAGWLQKRMNSGVKKLIFIIGGPYGFSEAVYARANEKLSLSRMTFSHQLVRVIFAEQLYRAFTILNNEPYHHE